MKHVITLLDDSGKPTAIATVTHRPVWPYRDVEIAGSLVSRTVLEHLRSIPHATASVSIHYPDLGRSVSLNHNPIKGKPMDLSHLLSDRENIKVDMPRRLLAPEPNVIPEDGIISFVVVETISDVLAAPQQAVLLFPDDKLDLLECVVQYADLFGFVPYVLSGLPTADYNAQFESKTFSLERVAYASFVNELVEGKRVANALKEQNLSSHDKERRQFTRRTGDVKELTGVRLAGKPDAVEPPDADDSTR